MRRTQTRAITLISALVLAGTALVAAPASATADVPRGDISAPTVPRPPADSGHGRTITTTAFRSPTGNVICRRVSMGDVFLECLLTRSSEIVHYASATSSAYGVVTIRHATSADRAHFANARRVPSERLIQLGSVTAPYPTCINDPNLGTSCQTGFDDQVGAQIFIGIQDSIWTCPGYEHVFANEPVPPGADRCRVVRA
jgi:hypothetical protein